MGRLKTPSFISAPFAGPRHLGRAGSRGRRGQSRALLRKSYRVKMPFSFARSQGEFGWAWIKVGHRTGDDIPRADLTVGVSLDVIQNGAALPFSWNVSVRTPAPVINSGPCAKTRPRSDRYLCQCRRQNASRRVILEKAVDLGAKKRKRLKDWRANGAKRREFIHSRGERARPPLFHPCGFLRLLCIFAAIQRPDLG